jgi:hypothetical protein
MAGTTQIKVKVSNDAMALADVTKSELEEIAQSHIVSYMNEKQKQNQSNAIKPEDVIIEA